MGRWIWRLVGLLIAAAAALGAFTFWIFVNRMPVKAAVNGQPLPAGFDVISVQIDILTLAITAMGIGLGVAAIFGYQALKDAAKTSAEQTARDTADQVATRAVAEHIEKLEDWKRRFGEAPSAPDPGKVVEVTSEEKGDVGPVGGTTDNPAAPE